MAENVGLLIDGINKKEPCKMFRQRTVRPIDVCVKDALNRHQSSNQKFQLDSIDSYSRYPRIVESYHVHLKL
ncbi:23418_t:CDS:2 [Dentiscutata erythropus]|uniref:23418_t:CDS:1 n=1 Tax=Dentiscutata erythropus TaxID=1348616 RepID=A0A9N9HI07_9GLOM|nr:23418_t:CDS:2 [Dentiscutata erythropus]